MSNYFDQFEHRTPPEPTTHSVPRELLWQFLATIALVLGAWYISWRWCCSLNYDALWYAIPLALAETMAYLGSVLFVINIWKIKDYSLLPPPRTINDCVFDSDLETRPVSVDVFIATYNEDPELVRMSIKAAKTIHYPHEITIIVHILDDGRRPAMKQVADEEGVNYISRTNNIGFKAGNLRNAMEQTSGDFIVICDADTRTFPTILEHTLGYFRDPQVAWVQTPQWFFDLPEGKPLKDVLKKYLWYPGYWFGLLVEKVFGTLMIGKDRFSNDPMMFYDVIQRRRNWANASFCCGAGSIHRREAVMRVALKIFASSISQQVENVTSDVEDRELRTDLSDAMRRELVLETEVTPYKFHVSEDIYTSIVLHSDTEMKWKSVYHPTVECKMLSPQDLLSWTIQRFKYAGGSLDIFFNDNPVFRKGLTLPQKLMYGATFYSYFAALWNVVFLVAPIIYLFTGIAPVSAYSFDFFKRVIPFLVLNEAAMMIGTWGISGYSGAATYLSFFPVNLRALWTVVKGEKIKFPTTPKDRQSGNFFHIVLPQFLIIVLTIAGLIYSGILLYMGKSTNTGGYIANLFWSLNNIAAMSGMVLAAFWVPPEEEA